MTTVEGTRIATEPQLTIAPSLFEAVSAGSVIFEAESILLAEDQRREAAEVIGTYLTPQAITAEQTVMAMAAATEPAEAAANEWNKMASARADAVIDLFGSSSSRLAPEERKSRIAILDPRGTRDTLRSGDDWDVAISNMARLPRGQREALFNELGRRIKVAQPRSEEDGADVNYLTGLLSDRIGNGGSFNYSRENLPFLVGLLNRQNQE